MSEVSIGPVAGAETEWALPLVIRIERENPPQRTHALEAAAKGVLTMLMTSEPEWLERVRAWDSGRIRKVVRRARGAAWRRARTLPGVTVVHHTARLRVYPPVPNDAWPPELSRLQVSGTQLEDPPGQRPPVSQDGPTILLNPDVSMTTGKQMAQVGHAAHLGWRMLDPAYRLGWMTVGFPLTVRTASDRREWHRATRLGPVVFDGGFTEVEPGTATAVFYR